MSLGRRPSARGESGMALLSALLTVALLTIIVVELADSALVHAHLSRNTGNALAAQILARSAVVAAEAILIDDLENEPGKTTRDQNWNLPLPAIPTRNGSVGFHIEDEGGKLDLNRVRDDKYRPALDALFEELEVGVRLLDAIEGWIDPNLEVAARATSQYCALPMACEPRSKPRLLASLDDLRVIEGFDDRTIRALEPFVTTLERPQGVNINTAEPEVLAALRCDTSVATERPPGGYDRVADATGCQSVVQSLLAVKSDVFSIDAYGTVGDVSQRVRTIVSRKTNDTTRLTWRDRAVSDLSPPEVP